MNESFSNDNPLSPSGRFGRLSYLGWSVLITILAFPFLLFALFLLNISAYGIEAPNAFLGLVVLIFIVIYLFFSYFNFIFMIRRLHDLDQSGWLSLLIFVPVGNIVLFLYLIFCKRE